MPSLSCLAPFHQGLSQAGLPRSCSACQDGAVLPGPSPCSHIQSTSAQLSNSHRLPAGCKERPELRSLSLHPTLDPGPAFPSLCAFCERGYGTAHIVTKPTSLWSQVCSLGRAGKDSSSLFPETTAETYHMSLKDRLPRWPSWVAHLPIPRLVKWSLALSFSPQMAWASSQGGWPGFR